MEPQKEDGRSQNPPPVGLDGILGIGNMIGGVSKLMDQLKDLAEKGAKLKEDVEANHGEGKEVQSAFGYTVKFGGESFTGGRGSAGPGARSSVPKTEPFVKPAASTRRATRSASGVREPNVDIFEEEGQLLIVAEMPGVSSDDIRTFPEPNAIRLEAKSGSVHYLTVIELPQPIQTNSIQLTANNGIVEIVAQIAIA